MDYFSIFVTYVILLFSLCVHEFAHAWSAYLCGDDTARLQGRMTLNPLAHIDPIGTVVIPILQMISPVAVLFGWAKPVPVNPNNFGRYRRDDMIVSLAGIIANFSLAIAAAVVIRILLVLMESGFTIPEGVIGWLVTLFGINVLLGVFNLIPIPPLDGFQFGKHFLPMHVRWNAHKFYRYGPMLLLVLLWSGTLGFFLRPILGAAYALAF